MTDNNSRNKPEDGGRESLFSRITGERLSITVAVTAILSSAATLISICTIAMWLDDKMDKRQWSVFEFGRTGIDEIGEITSPKCRLGELVLTSIDAAEPAVGVPLKKVMGYANKNEAYWIPSESEGNTITLISSDNRRQKFEKQEPDKVGYYKLVQASESDGIMKESYFHYLQEISKPGLLGLVDRRNPYHAEQVCEGFQKRLPNLEFGEQQP